MAYMCADSGNLMAIAQQLIQQKQQQQQQQQQQIRALQNAPSQPHPHSHPPFPSGPHSSFLDFHDDDVSCWMDSSFSDLLPVDSWHFPTEPSDLNSVVFSDSVNLGAAVPTSVPEHSKLLPDSFTSNDNSNQSNSVIKRLLDCANIIDSDPFQAEKSLSKIQELSSDLGDPTERVAFYFHEALTQRLNRVCSFSSTEYVPPEDFTLCYKVLNDACPYSKFAHLTANQAILEASETSSRIHIIDFGIVQGVQWAALLQALATRPTGKPDKVRISGIPAAAFGESPEKSLVATSARLKNFAQLLGLDFEFDSILTPVSEITESTFRVEENESLTVNFMLQLYTYLDDPPFLVERILRIAKSLKPSVVTLGEYDVNLNKVGFLSRFKNALEYYLTVFESIEPGLDRESMDRVRVERLLLGNRILKVVGRETDKKRRERMEERENWKVMMEGCGFETLPLSNYAISQAKLLLWIYNYSSKFTVVDSLTGFLSLSWEERPLLTVSSWH